jgi:photosystem II stability/assembly factor-like uncharacterized protein
MKNIQIIVLFLFILFPNLHASNNWELVDSIDFHIETIRDFKCADSLNCMQLVDIGYGGFYLRRTTDGGMSWKIVYKDSAYFHSQNDYHFVPEMRGISYPNEKLCIAVGDSGLVLRSTDKGDTWDVFRTDTNMRNTSLSMYDEYYGSMFSYKIPYPSLHDTSFFCSTYDGGKTWKFIPYPKWPTSNIIFGIGTPIYLNDNLFVGKTSYKFNDTTFRKYLIYVHNNWESWDTVRAPYYTSYISFADGNNVWIAGNEKIQGPGIGYFYKQYIFHSNNGGKTWEMQWDSVLNKFQIKDIEFFDKYFGLASSRLGQMLITENGGKTWRTEYLTGEKPEGYERIANHIQIPNRNTVYVVYGSQYIYKWTINTTDIAEQSQSPEVILTPNPAGDYVDIAVAGNRTLKDAVRVYDVLGVCVLTHPLTPSREGERIRINVSGLAAGVYFIRVGGRMYKFVKI